MARVVAVVADLMFASRIEGTLGAAGPRGDALALGCRGAARRRRAAGRRPRARSSPRRWSGSGSRCSASTATSTSSTRERAEAAGRRPGRAALADGARDARSWSRARCWAQRQRASSGCGSDPRSKARRRRAAARRSRARRPSRPTPQDAAVEAPTGRERRQQRLELGLLLAAVELRHRVEQVVERRVRVRDRDRVAAPRVASTTRSTSSGLASSSSPRRDQHQLRIARRAEVVDRNSRVGTPRRRSATPSAFQNAVAASTCRRPARRPPRSRSSPARPSPGRRRRPSTTESTHRVVGGQAGDARRVRPSRSRGRRDRAVGARDHRRPAGAARSPRRRRRRARARGRSPRSWMSRIAKSARPASSSFGASVEAPGWRTSSSTPASR